MTMRIVITTTTSIAVITIMAHDVCSAALNHRSHCHDHHHEEEPNALPWGHAHGPEPDELAGPRGWHRGVSAVVFRGSAAMLWRDHCLGFLAGAGVVLGRLCFDLRNGDRHRHHGRHHCNVGGRREGGRQAVCARHGPATGAYWCGAPKWRRLRSFSLSASSYSLATW